MYNHMVGINNSPTVAGAAFAAVFAAALSNGGSFNNILPGINYFAKLNTEGNFVPVISGPSTVQSGATPHRHLVGLPAEVGNLGRGADLEGSHPLRRDLRFLL